MTFQLLYDTSHVGPLFSKNLFTTILLVVVATSGCTATTSRYQQMEEALRGGDTHEALRVIKDAEADYGERSRLLYLMDQGIISHHAGQYSSSNAILNDATQIVDNLYTKRLHQEILAYLLNDRVLSYRGAVFEQVMINVIQALNYAVLGQMTHALIECRQIDHQLNLLMDSVDPEYYREGPWARYVTGIVYEAAGKANDAFIAYRRAYDIYRSTSIWTQTLPPQSLKESLLRITKVLRLNEVHEQYRRVFADDISDFFDLQDPQSSIIVVSYLGRAPTKQDTYLQLPISQESLALVTTSVMDLIRDPQDFSRAQRTLRNLRGQVVSVRVPRLVPQQTSINQIQIRAYNVHRVHKMTSESVYNVAAIAQKNLDDQFLEITTRALGRIIVQHLAAEGVNLATETIFPGSKNLGTTLGQIWNMLTNKADTRSWKTLSHQIHMTRLVLPPGNYRMEMGARGYWGGDVGVDGPIITLKAGETKFLTTWLRE